MVAVISNATANILLVKTDEAATHQAVLDLKDAGYGACSAADLSQATAQIEETQPALIVIDGAIAGQAGLDFCHQLRQQGQRLPILLLVDKETVEQRIACLEAGADDYLLKPYRSETFLRLVRFYLQPAEEASEQLRFGELVLDLPSRRVFRHGHAIDLTMKEFELLKYLMSHSQEVLTREQILENVWGYDFRGESNVIEVYIRYLCLKIESDGQKRLIHTVRGVGYVLRES